MKKTFSPAFKALAYTLFAVLFLTMGCKKDEAPDRDKFLGTFRSVSDNCRTTSYQVTITASSQATEKMILTNLNNVSSLSLVANVSGSSFTFEPTTLNNQTITGNGTISGNVLNINYAVQQGTTSFTCTASFNKQ
jgi:hypothetical protein